MHPLSSTFANLASSLAPVSSRPSGRFPENNQYNFSPALVNHRRKERIDGVKSPVQLKDLLDENYPNLPDRFPLLVSKVPFLFNDSHCLPFWSTAKTSFSSTSSDDAKK